MTFLCPHCRVQRLAVVFANPVDRGEPDYEWMGGRLWYRIGTQLDSMTIRPSIDAPGHWHGSITDGEVVTATRGPS